MMKIDKLWFLYFHYIFFRIGWQNKRAEHTLARASMQEQFTDKWNSSIHHNPCAKIGPYSAELVLTFRNEFFCSCKAYFQMTWRWVRLPALNMANRGVSTPKQTRHIVYGVLDINYKSILNGNENDGYFVSKFLIQKNQSGFEVEKNIWK